MRGFKIEFASGEPITVGSADGTPVQVIKFQAGDHLVGVTIVNSSESDPRPRKFGFTIWKSSLGPKHFIQTTPDGNDFKVK